MRAFGESLILGGFGAPMFLFLAGVAVAMSAGSKARRTGDDRSAMRGPEARAADPRHRGVGGATELPGRLPSADPRIDEFHAVPVAALGAAWLWEQRPTRGRWSPLQRLGRSSLFVYWIHVELVYGQISLPLHGAFSLAGAWTGFVLFSALMVEVVAVKDQVTRKYLSKIDLREKLSRQVQALMF